MSVKPMAGFDMENRDPNNLNEHLQVKIMISMITILFHILRKNKNLIAYRE